MRYAGESSAKVSLPLTAGVVSEGMILWNLNKNEGDTVGIRDVHFVQSPWFPAGSACNRDTARLEFRLCGVDVADLKPQGTGKRWRAGFSGAVAGYLDQRLARVEDDACTVFAGDRQADPVAVEDNRSLIVLRPEQHPAG